MAPHAPPMTGLTAAEVDERIRAGRQNLVPDAPSRTVAQIVRANVITPINGIMGLMFVLIMIAAPGPDALFAGVVISNSTIGIVQELRAKRELDRLAVLSAPKARVVRDGTVTEIAVSGVVADEVLELQPGDQIVVDGQVLLSRGLEANESLLTGESDPVLKAPDDEVMSGSFVAAGSGYYQATRIGAESYATTLAEEARRFKLANSELRQGINSILRWLTLIIPPVGLLLLWSLLASEDDWREALRGTVAASVAMVPDGLVLLTSIAFIVGILSLARKQALAKELASVELLARVDVLCLDKTGTITTGEISFTETIAITGPDRPATDRPTTDRPATYDEATVAAALGALTASDPNPNATLAAIAAAIEAPAGWEATAVVPFSSARKWSAAAFADRGTWVLGAPEVVLGSDDGPTAPEVHRLVSIHADEGRRLVLLAHSDTIVEAGPDPDAGGDPNPNPGTDSPHDVSGPGEATLPPDLTPVALVLLEDRIRPNAGEILEYFAAQGIALKVISGDHPATVAAVATRAGIPHAEQGVDARDLPQDPDQMAAVLDEATVFGRVTPHQKRAMVKALQSRGHVVAMTGDGVNDVLALKDADMGIAMGAGSPSTRAVAQLVLLDNAFTTLPVVLAEGRRVINNIERVANLFVAKAAYAVLLAALTGLFAAPFPFLPRHLTLIGTFSIGVPGFFLALEPNWRRAQTGFIRRVIRFAVPSGTVAGFLTFVAYEVSRRTGGVELDHARTVAVLVLLVLALWILSMLCRPLTLFRTVLLAGMATGYAVAFLWPFIRDLFWLVPPPVEQWGTVAVVSAVGIALLESGPRLLPWWTSPAMFRTSLTDGD